MAYEATQWVNGQTITVAGLNKLEQAVGEMNMSYSPHTWVDGEALTASKMNALEQAVASGSGGGTSYTTLYEGSVTTEQGITSAVGIIEDSPESLADTIKVTFNGTEYTCEKNGNYSYGATASGGVFDFSEYPFQLALAFEGGYELVTETAGTYTLKIEASQSGGSSDFSTAEVTIINNLIHRFSCYAPLVVQFGTIGGQSVEIGTNTYSVIIPNNGVALLFIDYNEISVETTVSGNAEEDDGDFLITGDCTITISESAPAD